MELDELANIIKSRRSIRSWQKKGVPEELLLKAIELATWAPNGGNEQNWYFYVITNRDTIDSIANIVQSNANRIASWPEAAQASDVARRMLERIGIFRNAPAIIVVTTKQYQSPIDKILSAREKSDTWATQIRRWRNTVSTRIQSVASGIAYLLLSLHQMGLGGLWMTGPMQAKGEIEKLLSVPEGVDAVALIPVGYPAENPEPPKRKPVQEVCKIIS
jgi:nitroreductase